MKKYIPIAVLAFALVLGISTSVYAGTSNLSGWAWSSNIGWISFNANDSGTGAPANDYGVSLSTTGSNPNIETFGGYAWSPNIGWISFNSGQSGMPNDVSNCPSGTGVDGAVVPPLQGCVPSVDMNSGYVTGFARILSMENQSGGGWLQLSGFNHDSASGGVTYATSGPNAGTFSGYAWEPSAVGWVSFDAAASVGGIPVKLCSGANCPTAPTSPSLTLLVKDPETGLFGSAAVITADQNGNASVPVEWNPQLITGNVQTGSSAWPEGIGATKSQSGTLFNAPGSENVSFVNAGGSPVHEALILTYMVGGNKQSVEADVTVNAYTQAPPTNTCVQPPDTSICPGSDPSAGTESTKSVCDPYDPTNNIVPPACEFTCITGYELKGSVCSKSSEQEF